MRKIIATFTDVYDNPIFRIYTSVQESQKRQKQMHRHTEFEISLILSGRGVYNTNLGDFEFSQGDIFLFSTNEYHYITDISDDGENLFKILNIQFSPAFIYSTDNSKDNAFMNIFLNRTSAFCNLLPRTNPHTDQIRQKFLAILRECEEKKPCYFTQVRGDVLSILISIFRHYNFADPKPPSNSLYNDISGLQKAIAYINENFCDELSLDDIANVANLSKFHFIRLFKWTYNMTTWDYINIKRINRSISLLTTTNETIINIALKSGFNTPANFNRIFKSLTGLTPKEYRKSPKN